jgi:hypothetical protein
MSFVLMSLIGKSGASFGEVSCSTFTPRGHGLRIDDTAFGICAFSVGSSTAHIHMAEVPRLDVRTGPASKTHRLRIAFLGLASFDFSDRTSSTLRSRL